MCVISTIMFINQVKIVYFLNICAWKAFQALHLVCCHGLPMSLALNFCVLLYGSR